MKEWDSSDWFAVMCVVFAVLAIGFIIVIAIATMQENQRLMNQCMVDGRKEYECHAMIRNRTVVTPVIITR